MVFHEWQHHIEARYIAPMPIFEILSIVLLGQEVMFVNVGLQLADS